MSYRFLLLTVLIGGCVSQPGSVVCPTGIVCPDGATCAAAQPVCIINPCGNGRVDTGETCDDGNVIAGDGCSPTCGNESCGNGLQEPGERCDDNNTISGDGCSADCLSLEMCGNGIKDVKEGCDDSNTIDGDGCRGDCKSLEFCGNALVDKGEVCDDGMPVGGPCSADCQSGIGCGNGFLDPGEQCDDGNTADNDDCRYPSCKHAVCGDGVENTAGIRFEQCDGGTTGTPTETDTCNIDCTDSVCGDGKVNQHDDEECDDGTAADSNGCDSDCTTPVCGDNHVNMMHNEQCDPGTPGADIATCDSDCTTPACGDNHVNKSFMPVGATTPEGCDDGGTTPGDGCSAVCKIESCGNGVTEMVNGEECDDGNSNDLDACRNNCQMVRCGDGVKSTSEFCDTGTDTAACDSADCSMPMCGDMIINMAANEQCEDGNMNNGDGCSSTCRLEPFVLTVALAGNGTGSTVTSNPMGINCGADCNELFLSGTMVTLNANPSAMSTFVGWSGACTGTAPCVLTMSQARSVTATFAANRLTVAKVGGGSGTVSGGGISCGATCTNDYTVGTMVVLTAAANSDSVFMGWSGGGCSGTGTCTVTMNSATTVTATFALDAFPLTVMKAGAGTGTVSSGPAGIDCGATCNANFQANTIVTLIAAPDATSNFAGWSGACTGVASCVVTMSQARSVTATFTLKPLTLTVSVSGGGTVSSNPAGITNCSNNCSALFAAGSMVTLSHNASANRAFTGWGGACSGTGACVVTMDAAKSVTATFEVNRLTVVRTGAGSGTVTASGINCGGNCTEDYNEGTAVAVTAAPASGSVFVGWSGPCTGTGTCNLTMNGPVTLTAEFADASTLTVSKTGTGSGTVTSAPAGINCGGTCDAEFQTGSMVVLTAAATAGSAFTGWSGGGCSGTGTCTVTLAADTTVTANFVPLRALTVTVVGTGTVTSTPGSINCSSGVCSEDFNENTIVTLSQTTSGTFMGWSGACSGTGACVVTLNIAKSVTATFNP